MTISDNQELKESRNSELEKLKSKLILDSDKGLSINILHNASADSVLGVLVSLIIFVFLTVEMVGGKIEYILEIDREQSETEINDLKEQVEELQIKVDQLLNEDETDNFGSGLFD